MKPISYKIIRNCSLLIASFLLFVCLTNIDNTEHKNNVKNIDHQSFYLDCVLYGITATETDTFSVVKGFDALEKRDTGNITILPFVKWKGQDYPVKSIDRGAFLGCTGLSHIEIPDQIINIGEEAFKNCTDLTRVHIPESVQKIGQDAFSGCVNLSAITVDSENGFYDSRDNCNAIIETAKNRLIVGCHNTQIPTSVTRIGTKAFADCKQLTCIEIPDNVKYLEEGAFSGCSQLSGIVLPAGITSLPAEVFSGCSSLTDFTIPTNVLSIYSDAFANCSSLISIVIPQNVSMISDHSFKGCSNLARITVHPDNAFYDSRNDCNAIIKTSGNVLLVGCKTSIIPNGVTEIASAFWGCSKLKSITVPESVTHIRAWAFSYCISLRKMILEQKDPGKIEFGESDFPEYDDYAKVTLYVPKGCREVYRNAPWTKGFADIEEW